MTNFFKTEPALLMGLVQSAIALIAAFGLDLSAEQVGAIVAFTAALLSVVTRSQVTPVNPPNDRITIGNHTGRV